MIDTYNFKGKKVLLRVDFNVPFNEIGVVTDDTRIRAALPTINKIKKDGGIVILMSHLGRPKNGPEAKFSLKQIVPAIESALGDKVQFVADTVGDEVKQKINTLNDGDVLLLENTRFYPEEKAGDESFSEQLAHLGDVYVNDAFGTAHRAHASTTVVANYFDSGSKMFGYLMQSEIENAQKVLTNAKHPFTAILGGAKVSDKIEIIKNLIKLVDNLIIGGAMAYTFLKANGSEVGKSLVEEDKLELAKSIFNECYQNNVKLYLPEDSVIADKFEVSAETDVSSNKEIKAGWMGLDIGPEAIETFKDVIEDSKTILWNGPMGVFEMEKFQAGTVSIAKAVAEATNKGAYSLIGGGDSVAAIKKFNLQNQVSYVSTGGGAMLEFFEGKELPGIKAITG